MEKLYRIKPIEWKHSPPEYDTTGVGKWADGQALGIHVWQDSDGPCRWTYCIDEYYDKGSGDVETFDEGVAKAEAFYLKHVLQHLTEAK